MNMQSKTKRWLAAASIVAVAGFTSLAQAKPPHDPMRGPVLDGRIIKQLDLTTEQQEKVKALREKHKAAREGEREQMRAKMEQFRELERSGASTAELKAQADVIAAAMSEKMVERAVHMREFRAILTAEQQVKMDELMEKRRQKHEAKMKERMEKHKAEQDD